METGIQMEVVWSEEDVTQILVSAWNGTFGGVARIYLGTGKLREAAEQLRGFPASATDVRELTFGGFDLQPSHVGNRDVYRFASGISMQFHCLNGAGHAYVDVRLQSDTRPSTSLITGELRSRMVQSVSLAMRIEASGVDNVVKELLRLETDRTGRAHLKAIEADQQRTFGATDLPNS